MMYILDIGSGHNPNPKANIFLERFFSNHLHRGGMPVKMMDNMVVGDAHYLPFKNNSIEQVYSNHVIEHLDDPERFLEECNRVGKRVKHTAPGIIHHIYGEVFFGGVGVGEHKYVWNPISNQWLDVELLRRAIPKYSYKQKLYISLVKLLPKRMRHLIFSTLIYIIAEYLENLNIDIVEYHYEK